MKENKIKNPLVSVFLNPRKTIRYLNNEGASKWGSFGMTLFLIWIWGLIQGFRYDEAVDWNRSPIAIKTAAIFLLGSLLVGLISLYFHAFIDYAFGRLFKGKALFKDIRTSILWSQIPSTTFLLGCYTLLSVFFGFDQLLNNNFAGINVENLKGANVLEYSVISILAIVGVIWSVCTSVIMYSEIQGFSVLKSCFVKIFSIFFTALIITSLLFGIVMNIF
ncbi:MAG: Yip1 family protein [Flavobacterium sp.]